MTRSRLCLYPASAALLLLSACQAPTSIEQSASPRAAEIASKSAAGVIWLEDLNLAGIDQDWGQSRARQSVGGHSLALHGHHYEHGIGTHADSEMTIILDGGARRFEARAGIDDETKGKGEAVFIIEADNRELTRSPVMHGGQAPHMFSVDLGGARRLTFRIEATTDSIDDCHADWADAAILLDPTKVAKPTMWIPDPGPELQIAPPDDQELAVHAPYVTGATPGRPFLFRIPATGARPIRFSASSLPEGLSLDPDRGIITGSLRQEGLTDVKITIDGPAGHAASSLRIIAGPHKLAQTPPMGWNSWNCWGTSVDDAKVRAAADALVASGLADRGFQFVNIDDAWEYSRDAHGHIRSNKKFPDMKALADYIHSRGLKLGIYSSPGRKTCAEYAGSYHHEFDDARTWAEWGVDLVKYDWCSYQKISPKRRPDEIRVPYLLMRSALDACGRDIVFSMCQYGMGDVWEWGAEVGGNYWRTTGDIEDNWRSMSRIGFSQDGHEVYAGPGHWNDPDMLVVGSLGWSDKLHPTKLTKNEQVTHITLWSMLAAPLLIGCDMAHMDDFTRSVLSNPEVLAVNQDALGQQGRRIWLDGNKEVWTRLLADGSLAVALFNRGRGVDTITVDWKTLGLTGPRHVRNLWQRNDEGPASDSLSRTIPRHGAILLKISSGT